MEKRGAISSLCQPSGWAIAARLRIISQRQDLCTRKNGNRRWDRCRIRFRATERRHFSLRKDCKKNLLFLDPLTFPRLSGTMNGGGGTATEEDDSKKYVQREWNCSIFSVGPRRVIYEHGHPQKEWREQQRDSQINTRVGRKEGRSFVFRPPPPPPFPAPFFTWGK